MEPIIEVWNQKTEIRTHSWTQDRTCPYPNLSPSWRQYQTRHRLTDQRGSESKGKTFYSYFVISRLSQQNSYFPREPEYRRRITRQLFINEKIEHSLYSLTCEEKRTWNEQTLQVSQSIEHLYCILNKRWKNKFIKSFGSKRSKYGLGFVKFPHIYDRKQPPTRKVFYDIRILCTSVTLVLRDTVFIE